jgi:rhamnose utilization protein RhaD (predicted bifunctional aldolase and dehydrogenase)/NAD(P)-dependent dehydrogenase (short-subunit alcohol dehydrogenase family)
MKSLWSDQEARSYIERYAATSNADIALRVYTSRLIGRDPALVLHGGGNTSVKTRLHDDLGEELDVLCVKGSGADLADIEPAGLPALRLASLQALRKLPTLDDEAMVNAQRTRMLDATAPNPSVETLLHAFLPHKFIDHSHADAILALVDQPNAEAVCYERFGARFGIVPYVMPGFALAKLAAEVYERNRLVEGLLLLKHGLFTFADSARDSYERHIQAVHAAETFAEKRRYWSIRSSLPPASTLPYAELAPWLRGLLGEGRRRYLLHLRQTKDIHDFVSDPKLEALCQVGCATPDHVIRTKRFPLLLKLDAGRTLKAQAGEIAVQLGEYRSAYRSYVTRQMANRQVEVTPLDPDPRIVLVPGVGLIGIGESAKAARIAADIYEHTIQVIRSAEVVGSYDALPEQDIFDMEYWSLEQAKLGKTTKRALDGRVVYVTGAAHGIGAAVARKFASTGAALYLVDRDGERLAALAQTLNASYEVVDVTDERALRMSVERCVHTFGGLDGVVSNAGLAPQGAIADCTTATLEQSFRINLFAHQWLASAAARVMRRQGMGGFLLFNASKAAFNPGPGFGPYAVPKAALIALTKQYALECGALGIRSNAVNADRVRTSLLDPNDVAERARARGLEPNDYYRANLLAREVSAEDVAEAFLSLALAESTTGSVVTVDGGNIAASPR